MKNTRNKKSSCSPQLSSSFASAANCFSVLLQLLFILPLLSRNLDLLVLALCWGMVNHHQHTANEQWWQLWSKQKNCHAAGIIHQSPSARFPNPDWSCHPLLIWLKLPTPHSLLIGWNNEMELDGIIFNYLEWKRMNYNMEFSGIILNYPLVN